MSKRKKTFRGRRSPYEKGGCNCYYCCGNPDKYHEEHKLKITKNQPKNWIDKDDEEFLEERRNNNNETD